MSLCTVRMFAPLPATPTGKPAAARRMIPEFIMSGYPHLEEAYWFGEGVLPELRRRGHLPRPA
jgi:hypothetical protein